MDEGTHLTHSSVVMYFVNIIQIYLYSLWKYVHYYLLLLQNLPPAKHIGSKSTSFIGLLVLGAAEVWVKSFWFRSNWQPGSPFCEPLLCGIMLVESYNARFISSRCNITLYRSKILFCNFCMFFVSRQKYCITAYCLQ